MKQIFIKLSSLALMLIPITLFAQVQTWETEVRVYPKPTISINATTFCQGDAATFTLTGTAPFTVTFTGNLGSYTDSMIFGGGSGLELTAGALDLITGATTYTVNIVAGSAGTFPVTDILIRDFHGCSNTVDNKTIIVNPEPSISFVETEICQHSNATFRVVPSDATVDIIDYTSTPAIGGYDAPITGIIDGMGRPGGQAGNFIFTIPVDGLKIASTGCKNLTVIIDTIIVHATPTVTINNTDGIVCQNDEVSVTFTGKEPFTVVWSSGDPAGLPTLYGTGGFPLIDSSLLSDGTGDKSYTATVVAESYGVFEWIGTLTDGNTCIANVSADITVNPAPTVTITSADLCEDGELEFNFTGSGTANSNQFTLCYGVQVATDVTVPTYGNAAVAPSTISLPNIFTTSLENATTGDAGSVSQYKATINPRPGKFKFILKSIASPDGCKSVNPDALSLGIGWCD